MRSKPELKWVAYHQLANWMETKDVLLSAKDAEALNKRKIIQPQTADSRAEVKLLRQMAEEQEALRW